jgi:hypothetical protein
MSISRYRVLSRRADSWPARAPQREPLWSRWYAPWLLTALVLAGLLVAAIAALELVTRQPTPSRRPAPVGALVPEVETIGSGR